MKHQRLIGLAAVGLALGLTLECANFGTQVQDFSVATRPNGAMANIQIASGIISGELLAVQDDGVIILNNSTIELVPYLSIESLHLNQLGGDYSLGSQAPDRAQRTRLALVSRYPQGIDAQLLQRLLAQLRQQEISVAR